MELRLDQFRNSVLQDEFLDSVIGGFVEGYGEDLYGFDEMDWAQMAWEWLVREARDESLFYQTPMGELIRENLDYFEEQLEQYGTVEKYCKAIYQTKGRIEPFLWEFGVVDRGLEWQREPMALFEVLDEVAKELKFRVKRWKLY